VGFYVIYHLVDDCCWIDRPPSTFCTRGRICLFSWK
jgi:hypothetical protein